VTVLEPHTKRPENRVPSPREDPVAAGRAAGIASGEARRRKREGGAYWLEALRSAVQEDAEQVAKKLLASGNGAAIAAGLQLVREYERGKQQDLRNLTNARCSSTTCAAS
jgi:hypothetical protein